jgi:nucleoside-diphosphate-sugar epimerase
MRIFVTGASGWIGSAVVPELLGANHEVVGLARSEASAKRLEAAGAIVRRGDVDAPDGLAKAAAESDGVIHLAFQHEVAWSGNFAAAAAADRRAVEAMGAVLAGSDRPFLLASGLLGLKAGWVATEDDGLVPSAEVRANPAWPSRPRPPARSCTQSATRAYLFSRSPRRLAATSASPRRQ